MWTTLALISALNLTPAQAGQLQLKNDRFTYGLFGQERKDSNFLPGDLAILSFDIDGLHIQADGSARYSMGMQLYSQAKKKNVFEQEPQKMEVGYSLGGTSLPTMAITHIFQGMEPGEYTMKVIIADLQGGKATKTLERKFTVKKMEFGIVNPGFVYNQGGGGIAPPLAVPGQNLMLHFTAVGFTEAGPKNLPKVSVKAEIQDEAGKPVLKKPIEGTANGYESDESKKNKFIPFSVPIQVNRTGKYKIVLSATDEHSHKKVTFPPLDLKVVDINK